MFWDEVYVLPYLNLRLPRVAQGATAIPGTPARRGSPGGAGGRLPRRYVPVAERQRWPEETQVVHLNPLSERWEPDLSHNQRHVNAAIFYNVWRTIR